MEPRDSVRTGMQAIPLTADFSGGIPLVIPQGSLLLSPARRTRRAFGINHREMVNMLRYSFVLLAGLWAAGPVAAANWADRLFDELSKDFGSVPRGPALIHHFRITNKTKQPVNIANVRVSCGCVTATALKTYLLPGEETALLVQMDTTRFSGVKSVTVFVLFDRPHSDEVRLIVQAVGRDDFTINPDTLAFGQVKKGATPAVSTVVTFYNPMPIQIGNVQAETNYIRINVKELPRQANVINVTTFRVTAQLRADAPVGKWYSDIWLKTNNPTLPQIRVPVTLEVESNLSISPDVVAIGMINVNVEMERRIIVRGVKPFKITGIDGKDEQIDIQESTSEEKKVHVLAVRFKGTKTGEIHRTVRLYTDLKEDNEIDFQVNANVIP
jgi:Protein of unknown function (DUF1573)